MPKASLIETRLVPTVSAVIDYWRSIIDYWSVVEKLDDWVGFGKHFCTESNTALSSYRNFGHPDLKKKKKTKVMTATCRSKKTLSIGIEKFLFGCPNVYVRIGHTSNKSYYSVPIKIPTSRPLYFNVFQYKLYMFATWKSPFMFLK